MRMCSVHSNGVNAMRNRHYTEWVPFSSAAEARRSLLDRVALVEAHEHELGIHSCRCKEGASSSYEMEAAVVFNSEEEDGLSELHRVTHTATVDTSGIRLDASWPRVAEWREVREPRMFSYAC
eukprot:406848-Prymnesium_polylepis.1